ncbi:adenyl-nucleotide exchange factor sse1 [Hypoxylon texense]
MSPASLLQPDDNQKNSTIELGCRGIEQNGQKSSKTQPAASQLVLDSPFGPHKSQSNMVSQWLDSLQDDPNHTSITKFCENGWQDQPADGGETSQTSSGPLSFTQGSRYNKSKKKRKASEMDGENQGDSISASVTTETPLPKIRRKPKFACHFYKMNQHVYGPCGSNGYGSMSHLMEHLRREHGPKDYYCGACWLSFSNAEALAAHSFDTDGVVCRPTGGTPVWELGAIPKTRIGDAGRWFWIWEKLFPRFSKPESPYWEPLNSVEQYRAGLRQLFPARLGQVFPPGVVNEVMNALEMHHDSWLTNPLEPRPYEPIPTPAATQSSNLNNEPSMANTSYGLEDVLQDQMQAPTPNTYGVELDSPLLWSGEIPNNTDLDTLAQQSVDVATDPPVDNNVAEEIFWKDYADPPDSDELAGNVDISVLFSLERFDDGGVD